MTFEMTVVVAITMGAYITGYFVGKARQKDIKEEKKVKKQNDTPV